MADSSDTQDMDHQATDAGAPQGDQAMVMEDQARNTDTDGEKQDSEARTEEEDESDGASSQDGDDEEAIPSGTGLLKPDVVIQPRKPNWPAVDQASWIGGDLTEGNTHRWQAYLDHRQRVGLQSLPVLTPRAAAQVDVNELPFYSWTLDGQRALTKAYALADGCCPLLGCETQPADPQTRGRHLMPIATFSPGHDSHGFLTGEGILEGAVSGIAGGDVRLRGDTLYAHWLAFHMQRGLTLTFPCPIPDLLIVMDLMVASRSSSPTQRHSTVT